MASGNFRIEKGDLVVSNRTYERVTGSDKLRQDLALWLLERIGTDPSTPTYGSTLDGGIIDGAPARSLVGQVNGPARLREVSAEVRRVLELYQQTQTEKMQLEMTLFQGKHTLTADQVLDSIQSIEATQSADLIVVRVTVITMAGQALTLLLPIEDNG